MVDKTGAIYLTGLFVATGLEDIEEGINIFSKMGSCGFRVLVAKGPGAALSNVI